MRSQNSAHRRVGVQVLPDPTEHNKSPSGLDATHSHRSQRIGPTPQKKVRRWRQDDKSTHTHTWLTATETRPTTRTGLALCCRVILDSVAHWWVPAGHPRHTTARKRRPWPARTQHKCNRQTSTGNHGVSHLLTHASRATPIERSKFVTTPRLPTW